MQDHRAGAELEHNFGHLVSVVYYAHLITNLDKPNFYTMMLQKKKVKLFH